MDWARGSASPGGGGRIGCLRGPFCLCHWILGRNSPQNSVQEVACSSRSGLFASERGHFVKAKMGIDRSMLPWGPKLTNSLKLRGRNSRLRVKSGMKVPGSARCLPQWPRVELGGAHVAGCGGQATKHGVSWFEVWCSVCSQQLPGGCWPLSGPAGQVLEYR